MFGQGGLLAGHEAIHILPDLFRLFTVCFRGKSEAI